MRVLPIMIMLLVAGPAMAENCTMVGNVLRCDGGLSATEIGNVWRVDRGAASNSGGDATLFRDGRGDAPPFEKRADAVCKRIGPMEFCLQPTAAPGR